ncbi:eukaryotic elongation factor 2 kinase-like [Actinia tenebrosa]|uniref:Eukaryotic elongation factor 2 kinase n=1 Tax=Actinia tenebrosa TaxID=6105 RepID=A0A6P8HT77_ACTTE|nr:eukaryotic elongation factor 2 kinase-like [Actinia tenebrosa]
MASCDVEDVDSSSTCNGLKNSYEDSCNGNGEYQHDDDDDVDDFWINPTGVGGSHGHHRKINSTSRSISTSSDEQCFDLEFDKEPEDKEDNINEKKEVKIIAEEKPKNEEVTSKTTTKSRKHARFSHQNNWKHALKKAMDMPDPWEKFHLDMCSQEVAIRHRYNALKKTWVKDEVRVKMESAPFDQGAMRVCYRLKKLSNFSKHMDWKHASNYVAKHYIEEVQREQYFDDVRLQMDAKLWGEEYNRRDPPKKVDIFQTYIIELKERVGSPLYHLEHYIEGVYKKYNSNSGFVLRDETLRSTPQAFSHFTFERSGHQMIVVDIQGVGDLYTDPQIHTADSKEYGEANLGPSGMALFFSTHMCNSICKTLGLTEFEVSDKEEYRIKKSLQSIQDSKTVVKSSFEEQFSPRKMSAIFDLQSHCMANSPPQSPGSDQILESPPTSPREVEIPESPTSPFVSISSWTEGKLSDSDTSETESDNSDVFTENSEDEEEARRLFAASMVHKSSSVCFEAQALEKVRQEHQQKLLRQKSVSVLGQVHFEMAKYNEIGRFTDKEPDMESAMYHLEKAATCNVPEALLLMAEIYLQLPHDTFPLLTAEENTNKGVEYMLRAAIGGERQAMMYMAKAYDTGNGLGTKMTRSWSAAVKWYQNAIDVVDEDDDPENSLQTDPTYKLLARQAELYLSGGYGLEKDPSYSGELYSKAGDEAMAAMNGKLANKFYVLAEEAWAEIPEDE